MSTETEAKVESLKLISDINPGSYQSIRFSRIKYKNNPDTFIDIRLYQRGYNTEGDEIYFPTKKGFQIAERDFTKTVGEYTLTPRTYVHPEVIHKSFDLLSSGQYESAVLQAFKLIEVKIREKTGSPDSEFGISLIRKAFHPDTGILTDMKLPKPEREAFSNYIAGAYGYYKNPCSHRDVDMDFIEAFDRIVVASDLLKKIEKAKVN